MWRCLGYSWAILAHLGLSPTLPASLTHACTMTFCPHWKRLRQALQVVPEPDVVALGRSFFTQVESQPDPAERAAHPCSPVLARAGWCFCPHFGEERVEQAKASQTSNAGCPSCFPDPRLGHGTRKGQAKRREGYSLPVHCSPNHRVAKPGKAP